MKSYKYIFILILLISFTNCRLKQQKAFVVCPKVVFRNLIPIEIAKDWHHLDIQKDTVAGTSLIKAYNELLKNKKGKEIIVAVMDNYIDIHHEDLKQAIWVNKKEIPNNGIDEDNNGYIDDIHGWNFLGNNKGEDLIYANTESTRILKSLQKKYANFPLFDGNVADSLKYIKAKERYKKDYDFMFELRDYALTNLKSYREAEIALHKVYTKKPYTNSALDSLKKVYKKDTILVQKIDIVRRSNNKGKDLQVLLNDSIKVEEELQITYKENYYDREVLGDKEEDLTDNKYGSNNMWRNATKHYHGTIVAGVIAANRANNKGAKGFSDQIKIMPILTTASGGSENDKDVALGIRYAVDNGAKVINMSFGKTSSAHPEWIKETLIYAEKHDVLVVAGAGNNEWDNDKNPFYPIDYNEKTLEDYCNNFIKVGSVTFDGNEYFLSDFTNYGKKTVDIFAPGSYVYTTYPENKFAFRDGTSIASPVVAGVAALIRSHYPKLTAAQVKQIILESGVSYDLEVQVPGEKVGTLKPFKELSKSGKVVNAYNALLLAEELSKK